MLPDDDRPLEDTQPMVQLENPWFEEFFDAIYQFTILLDAHGRLVRANRAALDLTGLTLEGVSLVPLWELPWHALTRQNRQDLKRAVSQAAQGRIIRKEIHLRRGYAGIFDFTIKPIQNGELADNASRWGRKYRTWFASAIAVSLQ